MAHRPSSSGKTIQFILTVFFCNCQNFKKLSCKIVNAQVVKTIEWMLGDVTGMQTRLWSPVVSIVASQSRASTSVERGNVAASEEAEMYLTMSLWSLNASPLSLTLPLALMYSAPVGSVLPPIQFHVWMHKASLLALTTPQIPTDGDVEAVNAEGGTPTLPETMLLGVGFHCSAAVQCHLHLLLCFNACSQSQCNSCSVQAPLLHKMQILDFA